MEYVARVEAGIAGRIGRAGPLRFIGVLGVVGVEALLIPAPIHRLVEVRHLEDVVLDVAQIGRRIGVGLDDRFDI